MKIVNSIPSTRIFQLWEFQTSHSNLLIRSPRGPGSATSPEYGENLDIHFYGVDYVAMPKILKGLSLEKPTVSETSQIQSLLGKPVAAEKITILASGGQRFIVVAAGFTITENDWDIFESPIEFRSSFRSKEK